MDKKPNPIVLFYIGILLLPIFFSQSIRATTYFTPGKTCQGRSKIEQEPQDPFRFLSSTAQDQGNTPTCGFHAGTVAIEAAINLKNSLIGIQKKENLSVVHAMNQLGFCTKSQFEAAGIYPVPFLTKMRKLADIRSFDKTVHEHYTDLCLETKIPFERLEDNVNSVSSIARQIADPNKVDRIPIPPYNIETLDFDGNEDPKTETENLFQYFRNPIAPPLIFSSCSHDSSEGCDASHTMNLVGVKKINCEGVISYTGIFKNSWGEPVEEWDLKRLLRGMIKYHQGYAAIHLCKDSECSDPSILLTKKSNPIYHLAHADDLDGISKLHQKGAPIDRAGAGGLTPLNVAAQSGHLEIVKYLVEHRADLNQAESTGFTPLNNAAHSGHLEIVKYLVEHGADQEKPNYPGFTPLAQAVFEGQLAIVQYLLSQKANPRAQGKDGRSILDLANHPENPKHKAEILKLIEPYYQQ